MPRLLVVLAASGCVPANPAPVPSSSSRPVVETPPPRSAATITPALPSATVDWTRAEAIPFVAGEVLGCRAEAVADVARILCGSQPSLLQGPPQRVAVEPAKVLPGDAGASDAGATFRWSPEAALTITLLYDGDALVLDARRGPAPDSGRIEAPALPRASSSKLQEFLCVCGRDLGGLPDDAECRLGDVPTRVDCARTHYAPMPTAEPCAQWRECETMEPSGVARCLDGDVHTGICPTCACATPCGPGLPACAPGLACERDVRDQRVCVAP